MVQIDEMTPELKAARLALMQFLYTCDGGDPEAEHSEAEKLLLAVWRAEGDDALADDWEAASRKWWHA